MTSPSYPTARLHYDLPPESIAQHPPDQRGGSRLLHVRVATGEFEDRQFADLPQLLPPKCALVLNNSRVIPARVFGNRQRPAGQSGTGARVELLYHRWLGEGVIEAVVGSNAKLMVREVLLLAGRWTGELLSEKSREGSQVRLLKADGQPPGFTEVLQWLEDYGAVPLPPYIRREGATSRSRKDADRYQTVYAQALGSVAAPTAGLHFTAGMLKSMAAADHPVRWVTLHVGLGTFATVHVDDLAQHEMHSEAYSAPGALAEELAAWRVEGRPVCAVGTTSLRVLHSVGCTLACTSTVEGRQEVQASLPPTETSAFIYPGHGTNAADLLLTNFHLPDSTLLALVYAFGGEELMRRAYQHAIDQRYRFFSYGDCMLIDRRGAQLSPDGTVVEDG